MTTPKKTSMTPILLIAAAGVVLMLTALSTESSFSLVLAIGLFIAAFTMWLQMRAAQKLAAGLSRDEEPRR